MARIPEREVERLKSEVSLARLVEAHGIVLTRHGADLLGLCPFHDDHEPSLVVSPKKNLWHCLGACQSGGSVIDWVMRLEGVSFRHAVELLREGVPPLAADSASPPRVVKQSTVPKLPAPVMNDADDIALLNQVIDYYHATLKQSPEALAYLQKRGLNHPDVIDHFKLGFANRTLGLRLPDKNRKAGAEIRTRLETLGVLRESGHEHFNGSLVIPVIDEHDQVTEVYGRKITDNLRPGTPQHLYLPRPHRGVFNHAGIERQTEVILCEALIDALTFWCAGYRNVTASYGINGFTPDILDALQACGAKRILLAYDRDEAGERAAVELAPKLQAAGFEVFRLLFPKGMDANAYALSVKPPAKSLGVIIRAAQWLGQGAPPTVTSSQASELPALAARTEASDSDAVVIHTATLPAAAVPAGLPPADPCELTEQQLVMQFGDRHYRLRGLAKATSFEAMKVNVLASRGESLYVDTVDLYSAKHRQAFARAAAGEFAVEESVIQRDRAARTRHAAAERSDAANVGPLRTTSALRTQSLRQTLECGQSSEPLDRRAALLPLAGAAESLAL